jgi:hypothetical protein
MTVLPISNDGKTTLGGESVQHSNNIADEETSLSSEINQDHLAAGLNVAAGARDALVWTALNNIPGLHAVSSGHGGSGNQLLLMN